MGNTLQEQRRKNIRAAEGYLDLATVLDDRWPLDDDLKVVLAQRALGMLDRIKNPQGHKPYILFLKGQCCRVTDSHEKAIRFLDQSIRIDPEYSHSYLALAWCYKRIDRIDLAIESMKTAVALDPESAISHYNLSCYCALNRQVNLSLVHLSFALDLNPTYRERVAEEADFDSIRENPRFISMTNVAV